MNTLYPIFIKAHQLQFLIVGGGYVALEKLEFLYKSSPEAQVTMVAPFVRAETLEFIKDKPVKVILKNTAGDSSKIKISSLPLPTARRSTSGSTRIVKHAIYWSMWPTPLPNVTFTWAELSPKAI